MSGNEIKIRWIETDQVSSRQLQAFDALLDSEEQSRAKLFRFHEDRLTFTATHALARSVLTQMTGRAPLSWRFRYNRYGKPEPITVSGEPSIKLSVSHTKGLAVVATSIGHELGVDAEWLGRPAPLSIAEKFFAPSELELLRTCAIDQRQMTFFEIWTLKEAYIKAIGKGLELPLDSFAFQLKPTRLLFSKNDIKWSRWASLQIRVGSDHIVALVLDSPLENRPLLSQSPANLNTIVALSELGT